MSVLKGMTYSHPHCAQDGSNLEQVNALTEEGHLTSHLGLT